MNLDDLPRIGDVVPMAVGLPAVGDDLNEHATHGRLGNVRNALEICFYVFLGLFVFDEMGFFGFDVNAGVLDRFVGVAAGDFDGEPGDRSESRRLFRGRGLLRAGRQAGRENEENEGEPANESEKWHGGFPSMFAGNGAGVKLHRRLRPGG